MRSENKGERKKQRARIFAKYFVSIKSSLRKAVAAWAECIGASTCGIIFFLFFGGGGRGVQRRVTEWNAKCDGYFRVKNQTKFSFPPSFVVVAQVKTGLVTKLAIVKTKPFCLSSLCYGSVRMLWNEYSGTLLFSYFKVS